MARNPRAALHLFALFVSIAHTGCETREDEANELPPLPMEVVEGDQPLVEDYEILGAVRGALWDDEEVGRTIGVDVHRGIVTLSGTVNDGEAKRRAVQQAEAVAGVRAVIDRLEIVSRPYVERRHEGGGVPSEALVEEAVREAWRQDERLVAFDLHVRVSEGVARLTGQVDLDATRRIAEQDAQNTVGVVEVENHIAVDDAAVAATGARRAP